MQRVYTDQNTNAAYQLNWTLALFQKGKAQLPEPTTWLDELKTASKSDGVRLLSFSQRSEGTLQFLISTRPEASPSDVVRSVKGRLQHLIRDHLPKAFRRNYHIQSVGEVNSTILDQYVGAQTKRHPMADESLQSQLESNQFLDGAVDLSKPAIGTYGQYVNSLQIVLETTHSWHEIREIQLRRVREVIIRSAKKKSWRLSRIGLLVNHVHVLVGVAVTESPQSVALSLMNNIAYVYDMQPILKFSFYTGTFGGYDRGAVRLHEQLIAAPPGQARSGGLEKKS